MSKTVALRLALLAAATLAASALGCTGDVGDGEEGDGEENGMTEDAVVGGRAESGYRAAGVLLAGSDPQHVSYSCTAVLIDPTTVLTAAHCVLDSRRVYGFQVGEYGKSAYYLASRVYYHPYKHDIAVVRLSVPVSGITPATLSVAKAGNDTIYVGYGRSTAGGIERRDGYDALRKSTREKVLSVDDDGVHVKGVGGGICWGDSGGPLFHVGTQKLVGILSALVGSSCKSGDSALFTRVDRERGFIAAAKRCNQGERVGPLPPACSF